MSELFTYIIAALVMINFIGFIIVGTDKRKAVKGLWRIPEKTFFILSILGGCPGIYTGLLFFRHKTRHWYFMWGIPVIFAVQIAIFHIAILQ